MSELIAAIRSLEATVRETAERQERAIFLAGYFAALGVTMDVRLREDPNYKKFEAASDALHDASDLMGLLNREEHQGLNLLLERLGPLLAGPGLPRRSM